VTVWPTLIVEAPSKTNGRLKVQDDNS